MKRTKFLTKSVEPHTNGLGYIPINENTDPTIRFAVVCDFSDGRWGKMRQSEAQLSLDKDGNLCK